MIRTDLWRGTRLHCPTCGYDKRFARVLPTMEALKHRCLCKVLHPDCGVCVLGATWNPECSAHGHLAPENAGASPRKDENDV